MYQKFTVTQLILKPTENCIILDFSLDLDEDTVNDSTVYLTESDTRSKNYIRTVLETDGKRVCVDYGNALQVNTNYDVHVTHGVQSVTGDTLAIEFVKTIRLESSVDSIVSVVSPADYEEVGNVLKIELQEIAGDAKKIFGNFEIEIASDVGFLDVLHTTKIQKRNTLEIKTLKPAKQYFLRARAINGSDAGNWSEHVTFTKLANPKKTSTIEDDDEIVFVKNLELLGFPENGETPNSFLLEFDKELDPDSISIDNIILTRKQV